MRTRIAYHTTDDVNHRLARRIAHANGSPLFRMNPGTTSPGDPSTTSLHDLDHPWPLQRAALVESLIARKSSNRVAVHGYCLSEVQMRSLRANGVIVSRTLNTDLFVSLASAPQPRMVPPSRESDPQADANPDGEPSRPCGTLRGRQVRGEPGTRAAASSSRPVGSRAERPAPEARTLGVSAGSPLELPRPSLRRAAAVAQQSPAIS